MWGPLLLDFAFCFVEQSWCLYPEMFKWKVAAAPMWHAIAEGRCILEQAALTQKARQLLILLTSLHKAKLEPASWQSTCFRSRMNVRSRKLI